MGPLQSRRFVCAVLPAAVLHCVFAAAQTQKPAPREPDERTPVALATGLRNRQSDRLFTAHIEYMLTEGPGGAGNSRFYEWRCAGQDRFLADHGDEIGRVLERADGASAKSRGIQQLRLLDNGEGSWWREVPGLKARVAAPADSLGRPPALHELGFNPVDILEPLSTLLQEGKWTLRRFDHDATGSIHKVRALAEAGTLTWWLDADRDFNPIRATLEAPGRGLMSLDIELAQYTGVWFPAHMTQRVSDGADSRILRYFEVTFAEFNLPAHPSRLDESLLDLDAGMLILDARKKEVFLWDGSAAISQSEFSARSREGLIRIPPRMLREQRRQIAQSYPGFLQPPSALGKATSKPAALDRAGPLMPDWERYVREFVEVNSLSAEQSQRALLILKDCQEAAASVIRAHRPSAPTTSPAAPGGGVDRSRSVADDFVDANLRASLSKVFEEQLAPRLERLLTSEQRAKFRPPRKPAD